MTEYFTCGDAGKREAVDIPLKRSGHCLAPSFKSVAVVVTALSFFFFPGKNGTRICLLNVQFETVAFIIELPSKPLETS